MVIKYRRSWLSRLSLEEYLVGQSINRKDTSRGVNSGFSSLECFKLTELPSRYRGDIDYRLLCVTCHVAGGVCRVFQF